MLAKLTKTIRILWCRTGSTLLIRVMKAQSRRFMILPFRKRQVQPTSKLVRSQIKAQQFDKSSSKILPSPRRIIQCVMWRLSKIEGSYSTSSQFKSRARNHNALITLQRKKYSPRRLANKTTHLSTRYQLRRHRLKANAK